MSRDGVGCTITENKNLVVLKTLFSVEIGRIGHVVGVGRGVLDVGGSWAKMNEYGALAS